MHMTKQGVFLVACMLGGGLAWRPSPPQRAIRRYDERLTTCCAEAVELVVVIALEVGGGRVPLGLRAPLPRHRSHHGHHLLAVRAKGLGDGLGGLALFEERMELRTALDKAQEQLESN